MEFINAKYSGDENNGRMEGEQCRFSYITEGMRYEGQMKDGQFHGKGTIYLSTGAKVEGVWHLGKLVDRTYIYKDGLTLNENVDQWDYCRLNPSGVTDQQDRRFYSEVLQQDGFEAQNVMPRSEHAFFSKDGINPTMK